VNWCQCPWIWIVRIWIVRVWIVRVWIVAVVVVGMVVNGAAVAAAAPLGATATGRSVDASGILLMLPKTVPVAIRIPEFGVSTTLVPMGVDSAGALRPPVAPGVAGWYLGSAVPGNPGRGVIVGHADSDMGRGGVSGLATLEPGDEVQVIRSDGHVAIFRVQSINTFTNDELATRSVHGPAPELALLVCDGAVKNDPAGAACTGGHPADVLVYAALA